MRMAAKKGMEADVRPVSLSIGESNGTRKGRPKLVVPMKRKNLSVKKKEPPATETSSRSTKPGNTRKAAESTPKKQKTKSARVEKDENGSDSDASDDMPGETDLEELYEVTYVEDYIDAVELVDDIVRHNSQLLEMHCEQTSLLRQIESEMTKFLGSESDDFDTNNLSSEKKEILHNLENILISASKVGDLGVRTGDEMITIIEEKLQTLHIDYNNLAAERAKRDPDTPDVPTNSKNVKKPSINPPKRMTRGTPNKLNMAEAAKSDSNGDPKIPFPSAMFANGTTPHSPAPSFGSSSSFDTNKSGKGSQQAADGNHRIDDSRYRACKFKNPPNYVFNSRFPTSNTSTPNKPEGQKTQKKINKEENETKSAKSNDNGKVQTRKSCSQGSNSKQGTDTAEDSWEDSSSSDSDSDSSPEPTYCLCEKISHGKMVQCDNDLCPIEWFHFKCVNLKKIPKGVWFCPRCRGENACVMKPKQQFLKELAQYNKEKENED